MQAQESGADTKIVAEKRRYEHITNQVIPALLQTNLKHKLYKLLGLDVSCKFRCYDLRLHKSTISIRQDFTGTVDLTGTTLAI